VLLMGGSGGAAVYNPENRDLASDTASSCR